MIVNYGDMDFGLNSGVRRIRVADIKSILATEAISADYPTRKSVNFAAYLSDAEYKSLLSGYTARMLAFDSDWGEICLLSCNPKFTQLDLYLYCCLMGETLSDVNHPYFNWQTKKQYTDDINDFYLKKNTKKAKVITKNLERCKECWLTMAKYLKDSQTIMPEAREKSIARLVKLADDCDVMAKTINDIAQKNRIPTDYNEQMKLDAAINNCIFPELYFPSKYMEHEEWVSYLAKRGIILKFLAWD
jgi:hypothetical protein